MIDEQHTKFVEVLLPLPLKGNFTYRVPAEFNDRISRGMRVVVQFGRRRFYTAVVLSVSHKPPVHYEAKYLYDLLDDEAFIDDRTLKFWRWMSAYYMCEVGEVMNAALPTGLKIESETLIIPNDELFEGELDPQEEMVFTLLESKKKVTASDVSKLLGSEQKAWKILRSMYEKGVLWFEEAYHERYTPKKTKYVSLKHDFQSDEALQALFESLERAAPKQLQLLMHYIQLSPELGEIKKKHLLTSKADQSPFRSLCKKGVFMELEKESEHLVLKSSENEQVELTPTQLEVYHEIKQQLLNKRVCLMKGVAASGKTILYIKLISEAIKEGKQVLYLLPEIAMSYQFVNHLSSIFGEDVVFTHSRYGKNEQTEVFSKIRKGEVKVLIAARSGIFMPFKNLGLIVVDEEHDTGYKQFDPAPRYHARDAAIYLSTLHGDCKVILGSATPSFESIFNANVGKYAKVELKERYMNHALPEVKLIKRPAAEKEKSGIFSEKLIQAIKDSLSADERVILFHNQRGFVPQIECTKCGWRPKCINCDISLTYYKSFNQLKCHYCGFRRAPFNSCNACGDAHLSMSGFGTEKIEEELKTLIPEAVVQRFDQASTSSKNAFDRLLERFENGEINVLIGTQMITKGLDFKRVGLVGILNADQLLNYPDFRSFERAFQHILQAGGRAGRLQKKGLMLIQTHLSQGYIADWLCTFNYDALYDSQIAERKDFNYPPYARLIRINIKSKDLRLAEQAANALCDQLKMEFGYRILGPEKPYVSRIRGYYQYNILFKFETDQAYADYKRSKQRIHFFLRSFSEQKSFRRKVRFQADVDPV